MKLFTDVDPSNPKGFFDNREPSRIKKRLEALGWVEKTLDAGDYLFDGTIVERTTVSDLLHKISEKRYRTQLMNLKNNIPENVRVLWLVEGNLKSAFMERYGSKWGYSASHRKKILGAVTSLYKKHGFNIIFSPDVQSSIDMLDMLAVKKYENNLYDVADSINSPVKGLGSQKFGEIMSWFSVWANKPFTHLTDEEIIELCERILKREEREKIKKMRGIGRTTVIKVMDYYRGR